MFDVALADKVENEPTFAIDREVSILQRRDSEGLVSLNALFAADANVERVYQTHHDSQDLFPWEAFQRQVLVRRFAELRQHLAETLDLFVFLFLLSVGKFRVIFVLDPPGRIDADGLKGTVSRR